MIIGYCKGDMFCIDIIVGVFCFQYKSVVICWEVFIECILLICLVQYFSVGQVKVSCVIVILIQEQVYGGMIWQVLF